MIALIKLFTNQIQISVDNNTMNTIKFNKSKTISLNGVVYKPYNISDIPPSFGYKAKESGDDVSYGISEWFNYKGQTYVRA